MREAARGETLRAYSERMHLPHLLEEFDAERNAPLTPDTVFAKSRRRVWWRCGRGHGWEASLDIRANGTGCPYCAGKRPLVGENDLAARHPALAAEWSARNGALRPQDVTAGSNKKVWWRCASGHEWQATVYTRVIGGGCPVCLGRKVLPGVNDLATLFPELAGQWSAKNGALLPTQVRPFSNKRVWWECGLGHTWQATPNARISHNSGCPYCANRRLLPGFNDLQTRFPAIAAEWHPRLNGALTPDQVLVGTHKKAWWRCAEGHVWQAVIASRTGKQKCGCPVCAGNISKKGRERYERELAAVLPPDEP